jgi:hypothetical protein
MLSLPANVAVFITLLNLAVSKKEKLSPGKMFCFKIERSEKIKCYEKSNGLNFGKFIAMMEAKGLMLKNLLLR